MVDQVVQIPSSSFEQKKEGKDKEENPSSMELLVHSTLELLLQQELTNKQIILKGQTFPPTLQQPMMKILNSILDDNDKMKNVSLSTADYTHDMSCIEIFDPKSIVPPNMSVSAGDQELLFQQNNLKRIYMIGLTPHPKGTSVATTQEGELTITKLQQDNSSQQVCRAFFKLKEVMEYYRREFDTETPTNSNFENLVAFDCGSSPGGWTKYLLEYEKCRLVYSCDTGNLDPTVKEMNGTKHLQMKGMDAISMLQKEGCVVDIWVSDMCLANPKDQIDHLVVANKKGLLAKNAFFVLTLKFNTGHSKDTFDKFAKIECERLGSELNIENLQMYHLFSNRKGERTLVGRII